VNAVFAIAAAYLVIIVGRHGCLDEKIARLSFIRRERNWSVKPARVSGLSVASLERFVDVRYVVELFFGDSHIN